MSQQHARQDLEVRNTDSFVAITLDPLQPFTSNIVIPITNLSMAESSLAADLLADFNESENEDEDFGIENKASHSPEPSRSKSRDFLELDGDEEEDGSEDEEMGGVFSGTTRGESDLADDDDEEARKAKVEKMQLGGVDDVRSVAGLMKVLEPVLEVCVFYIQSDFSLLYTVKVDADFRNRKSNITRPYRHRQGPKEVSKIIQSTSFLSSPMPTPYLSIMKSSSCTSSFVIIMLFDSPSSRTSLPTRWTMRRLSPLLATTWISNPSRPGMGIACVPF